jgi:hypothetical protein
MHPFTNTTEAQTRISSSEDRVDAKDGEIKESYKAKNRLTRKGSRRRVLEGSFSKSRGDSDHESEELELHGSNGSMGSLEHDGMRIVVEKSFFITDEQRSSCASNAV